MPKLEAAEKAGRTAADGVVAARVADDGSYGVLVEVNSETDFVARDENFLGFVGTVVDAAFTSRETDVAALMSGDLESAREALVQKIGENIGVRRIALVDADSCACAVKISFSLFTTSSGISCGDTTCGFTAATCMATSFARSWSLPFSSTRTAIRLLPRV